MNKVIKFLIRRSKFNFAPFLISPNEYWGYIKTAQQFHSARTIIKNRFIIILGIILALCLFTIKTSNNNIYIMGILIIFCIMIGYWVIILLAIKDKWWISLSIMSCVLGLGSLLMLFIMRNSFQSLPLFFIILYLSISHFIMLLKVKKTVLKL